jgi:hypothetical protein
LVSHAPHFNALGACYPKSDFRPLQPEVMSGIHVFRCVVPDGVSYSLKKESPHARDKNELKMKRYEILMLALSIEIL